MRSLRIVSLFVVLVVVSMAPVHAEGSRTSSMYEVLTGFKLRNYWDNGWDGTASWVCLSGCYVTNPNLPIPYRGTTRYHVCSVRPNLNMGTIGGACGSSGILDNPGAGSYVGFYHKVNADMVNYGW